MLAIKFERKERGDNFSSLLLEMKSQVASDQRRKHHARPWLTVSGWLSCSVCWERISRNRILLQEYRVTIYFMLKNCDGKSMPFTLSSCDIHSSLNKTSKAFEVVICQSERIWVFALAILKRLFVLKPWILQIAHWEGRIHSELCLNGNASARGWLKTWWPDLQTRTRHVSIIHVR